MWIAVLVGVGAGLLVAMWVIARQERRYRVLFSDTHLAELAKAVEAARTGSPAATFEGLTLGWERLPGHIAITIASRNTLAAPAARFLLTFVRDLVGASSCQGLQTGKQSFAALFGKDVLDADRPLPAASAEDLNALRLKAADAMRDFAIVEGALSAYR